MDEAKIRVETPNAFLGHFLVEQLHGFDARVIEVDGGRWTVELPADTPRERVLQAVQHWLNHESVPETVVHVDGTSCAMTLRSSVKTTREVYRLGRGLTPSSGDALPLS